MSSNPTLATAAFRISSQQERAWLEHERGLAQFAQCLIRIEGPLDVDRLRDVLQSVVEKYEILRTVLRRQTGVKLPFQIIQGKAAFEWSHATADANLHEVLNHERASVARAEAALHALLVSGESGHILALTLPAFCADSSTLKNLFGEIAQVYSGKNSESDDVMQYADLVEWQNELLASDESKPGRDFWRELCRRIDFASLDSQSLPLERKPGSAFEFSSVAASLPLSEVEAMAAHSKASLETVLLSAWGALLIRLTGMPEVTLGYESDGRRYEELATALGPLARSLPLRIEVAPKQSFSDLVQSSG